MATARLDDVRFSDIRTFLAVRRYGSISAAAREMNVTPSQVSKAVARLEEQLSLELLTRTAKGVSISDAGKRIVPQLEDVVAKLERLHPDGGNEQEQLTVAAPSYLNAIFLPLIAECLPQYRVRGLEMPPALVRAYAADSVFDITVTVGQGRFPGPWASERVGDLRKALFANPEGARKLGRPPVTPEALRDLPFIGPVYMTSGQLVPVDDGCPLARDERRAGHEASTFALGLELAVRSGQLLFGPVIAAKDHLERRALVEIPVEGWTVTEPLYLACNGDRVLARSQAAILKAFRAALSRLQ